VLRMIEGSGGLGGLRKPLYHARSRGIGHPVGRRLGGASRPFAEIAPWRRDGRVFAGGEEAS